jgi:hypothetical protein
MKRITGVVVHSNYVTTKLNITRAHLKALGAFLTAMGDDPVECEISIGDLWVKIAMADDEAPLGAQR